MTTNATRRRQNRDAKKVAKGSLTVPTTPVNSHIGMCSRCDRSGLINDEGICTSYRTITAMPFFEPRSKRCDAIVDERERKRKQREKQHGRA